MRGDKRTEDMLDGGEWAAPACTGLDCSVQGMNQSTSVINNFVFTRSINPSVQASQIAFYSSSGNWNEHMWGKQPGDHSLINPAGKRSDMLLV